jgi:hypothetical protein
MEKTWQEKIDIVNSWMDKMMDSPPDISIGQHNIVIPYSFEIIFHLHLCWIELFEHLPLFGYFHGEISRCHLDKQQSEATSMYSHYLLINHHDRK